MEESQEIDNQKRLTRLETQMENLTKLVSIINDKLDIWNDNYVPRSEINEMFRGRDKLIEDINIKVDKHLDEENNNKRSFIDSLPNWVSLLFGFIMLLIAIYALNR